MNCIKRAVADAFIVAAALSCAGGEAETRASRGFGEVRAERAEADGVSVTRFTCASGELAARMASKRKADLLGFGDLREVASDKGTLLELAGTGRWLLGVKGERFYEAFAADAAALDAFCASAGLKAVRDRDYPAWMDCFDNGGPAIWVGGGGDQYQLPNDFEWLKKMGLGFCTLSPKQSCLVAPGLYDRTIIDWHEAVARKYDLRYRQLMFHSAFPWAWNLNPLPYVKAMPRFLPIRGLHQVDIVAAGGMEPTPETDVYRWDLRRMLARDLADSRLMGWHGCDEIPSASVNDLQSVAEMPHVKAAWKDYCRKIGRKPAADGHVPTALDFLGWDPRRDVDLMGEWEVQVSPAGRPNADPRWFRTVCWNPILLAYGPNGKDLSVISNTHVRLRRSFKVPSRTGAAGARYLHLAVPTHRGFEAVPHDVRVNGVAARVLTNPRETWSYCYDVSAGIREGGNEIEIDTHGQPLHGYCFLNGIEKRDFPFMAPEKNALWYDAINFSAALHMEKIENELRAIRSVDPDRPLKMMATKDFLDLTTDLCARYGAYQHDTGGAGAFWCPMTGGRLARSHGFPWSCEQGGPPGTLDRMVKAVTFYLNYGNDAADLVFGVGHYTKNPEIRAWCEENGNLIRAIGKLHMPHPPIAILRSTRNTRLGFRTPWNYDIGRGPLQELGYTFEYVETCDLADTDLLGRYAAICDAGTVMMTEADVEGIRKYVERGGVFLAQFHTGCHSPAEQYAWPLLKGFGRVELASRDERTRPMEAVSVPLGKGRLVYEQREGLWRRAELLGGLFAELGLKPDSRPVSRYDWGTRWESKNGVYDLYMASLMGIDSPTDHDVPNEKEIEFSFRADRTLDSLVDLGAKGHPSVPVATEDGYVKLPPAKYGPYQTRLYGAPSADPGGAALRWFRNWCEIWRPTEKVTWDRPPVKPDPNVLPLDEGWQIAPFGKAGVARTGRPGLFETMGYPEDARVTYTRRVKLPASWKGSKVSLTFDSQGWFWGILPHGVLTLNGERPEGLVQPLVGRPAGGGFTIDVTRYAETGEIVIEADVDGSKGRGPGEQQKPYGISGVFYLSRSPAPKSVIPLDGPWFAAEHFGVLKPVKVGEKAPHVWYETAFPTPATGKGARLFLKGDVPLRGVVLNDYPLEMPDSLRGIDITRMVNRDGKPNRLYWARSGLSGRRATTLHHDNLEPLRLEIR